MMSPCPQNIITLLILLLSTTQAKILRNKALINKMVSNFQRGTDVSEQETGSPDVFSRMQSVLCKNFPSIPCEMITQDKTLRKLIEKSIQQINYKKLTFQKTTPFPGYLTLFPTVNSDDLSNFLQEQSNGRVPKNEKVRNKKKQRRITEKVMEKKTHEKRKKIKNKSKRTSMYSRKKLRKFYPHKVKYRDKNSRNIKEDFGDNSAEKLSMSVEVPDMTLTRKHQHLSYKVEPANPPVWRIDYMKHGEPSLNMFGFESQKFGGKIMKTGPNVIVDGNLMSGRKDVLHPDVYIKNNFGRKNPEVNSDIID